MVVRITTRRDGALIKWLPEVFYRPDIYEKYGDTFDTPQHKEKMRKAELANQERKDRMKYGSKKVGKDWGKFRAAMKKAVDSKKLRPGEVKRYDKAKGKWVSNKD